MGSRSAMTQSASNVVQGVDETSLLIPKPAKNASTSRPIVKSPSTSSLDTYAPTKFKDGRGRHPSTADNDHQGEHEEWMRHNSIAAIDYNRNGYSAPPKPLFQRLFNSYYNVTNPSSPCEANLSLSSMNVSSGGLLDAASIYSVDLEDQSRRLSILSSMRPLRLIGNYNIVANWKNSYIDTSKINNSKLKKYYEDQNYLIERFMEIDNLLDAGKIHLNMLSNYYTEPRTLGTHNEVDESNINEQVESTNLNNENNVSQNTVNSKFSRFNEIPGNVHNEGAHFLGYNEEEDQQSILIAILVNFFINFVLLIGKLAVTILTNSISIVASLVDSILDFLSTFIIYIANKLSTTKNWRTQHAYPIGRSRLEPLGVLIFSVIIILSFFQVGQESFKRLFLSSPKDRYAVEISNSAISIMTLTIISKIGCWLWCSKSKSSSIQALAQDAKTDIVFNLVSLLMPTIGYFFNIWWLDPLGALVLSIYIIVSWCVTAFEHIDNLTGAVANQLDYKVVLYLAYRFAESIKKITSLKVYHVGDNLNVEIDVVFSYEEFNLTLKDCHDTAEALQYAIESLPMVERAFVHIDYMEGNFKGHLK